MRLQVEDLAYSYGEKDAVDQVSLQVERGEFVGLIGPNGTTVNLSRLSVPTAVENQRY